MAETKKKAATAAEKPAKATGKASVTATKVYYDQELSQIVKAGTVLEVTAARAAVLKAAGVAE